MYSQSFSGKQLYYLTTQAERRDFSSLGKDAFCDAIDGELSAALSEQTYTFDIKNIDGLFINARPSKTFEEKFSRLCQDLVLRKMYQNIRNIYYIKQANRDIIIRQIQMLLNSNKNCWIIRLDIKSFYESLNKDSILGNLCNEYRLSPSTVFLLKQLFNAPAIQASTGVPRGLSISSCLSELAMKYFDIEIKQYDGVYYYARFVDDIIVFCTSEDCMKKVWDAIDKKLQNMSLMLNESKSCKLSFDDLKSNSKQLVYLGYSFFIRKIETEKNGKKQTDWVLCTDIASSKVNKIKSRIVKAFVSAKKNGNISLLKDRIKYLTGNYSIQNKDSLLPMKSGIYYNYKRIDCCSKFLQDLDAFYQNILHCNNRTLGMKLKTKLTKDELESLKKYSFRFGFRHRTYHGFTPEQIHNIKKCWL